jgi:tol-pal system protein YbgF
VVEPTLAAAPGGEPVPPAFGDTVYGGEVEVVYEGEAARPSRSRPQIVLHESARSAVGLAEPAEEGGVEAEPVAPLPELGSERLPVLDGRIPTVGEQLRRARTGAAGTASPRPSTGPVPGAPAARPVALETPAPPAPAARAPAHSDPIAEYRVSMAALRSGKHQTAAAGMRAFLGAFPGHYLADNAQYYLAESYYQRELYSVALGEYRTLVERYWRGNKLPDALLKIGLCQLALGHREAGRAALRRLVTRFPRTRPARLAGTKLEELSTP